MRNLRTFFSIYLLFLFATCRKDGLFSKNNSVSPSDFLSEKKYEKLVVEVKCVSGYELNSTSLNELSSFLSQRLNKSEGISIAQHAIVSPGKSNYTLEDIKNIEGSNRTANTSGNTIGLFVFIADGDYTGNSGNYKTLGITYSNSSVVLFGKTIHDFSGGIGQPSVSVLETTVTEHEFGHVLGLVNNGSSMQVNHQDVSNGKHCNNQNCLMYFATETSDIISNLIGNNIPALDNNCINDLKANGGK